MHFRVNYLFTDVLIDLLRGGERVRFRAPGSSMHPTIRNEEVIGVEPVKPSEVKRGDIILYQNGKGVIAHRVVRIMNERPEKTRKERSLRTLRSVSLKDRPNGLEAKVLASGLEERPFRASRTVSLEDRLKEPRGAAFGLEARGAAYSLEDRPDGLKERELRSLEGNPSNVSACSGPEALLGRRPQAIQPTKPRRSRQRSSNEANRVKRSGPQIPPQAGCSSSETLLRRSGRFESLASSEAVLDPQPLSIEHSALSFEHSSLSPHCSALSTLFVLRGDASDTCDEPVEGAQILGKVVSAERDGRVIDLNSKKAKILQAVRAYIYRTKRAIIRYVRSNGIMEKWNNGVMGTQKNLRRKGLCSGV